MVVDEEVCCGYDVLVGEDGADGVLEDDFAQMRVVRVWQHSVGMEHFHGVELISIFQ